jgi:hypothetical protein
MLHGERLLGAKWSRSNAAVGSAREVSSAGPAAFAVRMPVVVGG